MSRPTPLPAFLVSLFLVLLFLGFSNAYPMGGSERSMSSFVLARAPNDTASTATQSAPTTFQTVSTSETVAGEMVQTCTITLTPIIDASGNPEVVEVESCTVTMNTNSTNAAPPPPPNNLPPPSPPSSSSSSSSTTSATVATSVTTPSNNRATATPSSSTTSASATTPGNDGATATPSPSTTDEGPTTTSASDENPTTTPTTTSSPPTSSSSTTSAGAVQVNGFTTVQSVPTPASPATVPTATTATAAAATAATATAAAAAASTTTTSGPSAAAAAESPASSSQTTFTLPGKKLSVLPIGLAVFAGISVIALIVVGLVTYERTKYRKAFRQRKLAEAGATTGYGGMAQIP